MGWDLSPPRCCSATVTASGPRKVFPLQAAAATGRAATTSGCSSAWTPASTLGLSARPNSSSCPATPIHVALWTAAASVLPRHIRARGGGGGARPLWHYQADPREAPHNVQSEGLPRPHWHLQTHRNLIESSRKDLKVLISRLALCSLPPT